MQAASLSDIKKELDKLPPKTVKELCLRLAKYKKENKELLTYLLFEAGDEQAYIKSIQEEIDEAFAEVNKHSLYHATKTIRKILRTTNKYIKYSGNKQTEVELLMYYCLKLSQLGRTHQKQYCPIQSLSAAAGQNCQSSCQTARRPAIRL